MMLKLFFEYVITFHLEVIGAGGAVWGFSEMVSLRNNENFLFWRYISLCITFIFLIRWIIINCILI